MYADRTIVVIRSHGRMLRNADDGNREILKGLSNIVGIPSSIGYDTIFVPVNFFDTPSAESEGMIVTEWQGTKCHVVRQLTATWDALHPELVSHVVPGVVSIVLQSQAVFDGEIA